MGKKKTMKPLKINDAVRLDAALLREAVQVAKELQAMEKRAASLAAKIDAQAELLSDLDERLYIESRELKRSYAPDQFKDLPKGSPAYVLRQRLDERRVQVMALYRVLGDISGSIHDLDGFYANANTESLTKKSTPRSPSLIDQARKHEHALDSNKEKVDAAMKKLHVVKKPKPEAAAPAEPTRSPDDKHYD